MANFQSDSKTSNFNLEERIKKAEVNPRFKSLEEDIVSNSENLKDNNIQPILSEKIVSSSLVTANLIPKINEPERNETYRQARSYKFLYGTISLTSCLVISGIVGLVIWLNDKGGFVNESEPQSETLVEEDHLRAILFAFNSGNNMSDVYRATDWYFSVLQQNNFTVDDGIGLLSYLSRNTSFNGSLDISENASRYIRFLFANHLNLDEGIYLLSREDIRDYNENISQLINRAISALDN